MRLVLIAAIGLMLAACTPPAANTPAQTATADMPKPAVVLAPLGDNPRDALIGCAAVAAAKGNLDTAARAPTGPDTDVAGFYWLTLALLDKEAMPPEAKQAAIEALKKIWGGAPVADLDARLAECRTRFAPQ